MTPAITTKVKRLAHFCFMVRIIFAFGKPTHGRAEDSKTHADRQHHHGKKQRRRIRRFTADIIYPRVCLHIRANAKRRALPLFYVPSSPEPACHAALCNREKRFRGCPIIRVGDNSRAHGDAWLLSLEQVDH